MKKQPTKVITYKNMPPRIGLGGLIAVWLLMDRLGAPQWGFGVFYTIAAILIVGSLVAFFTVEQVDLFEQDHAGEGSCCGSMP